MWVSLFVCHAVYNTFFLIDISKGVGASAIRFNIEIPIMAKRRSIFLFLLYLLFKFVEDAAYQRHYVTGIVDTGYIGHLQGTSGKN